MSPTKILSFFRHPLVWLVLCFVALPIGAQAQFSKTLVPKASTWKYPANFPNLDGTNWTTDAYNDSAWLSGPGPIGYGDSNLGTTIPSPANPKPITLYMRTTFTVSGSDRAQIQGMFLAVRRDDGAVVHLNGVEIARFNMPDTVPIVNTTTSVASVGGADETTYYDYIVGPTVTENALKSGVNVLALEIHQENTGSSDTQGDLQLIGSEVPVEFGDVAPGRAINFEDAEIYGFLTPTFTRIPSLGHTDYNWKTTQPAPFFICGADFAVETAGGGFFDMENWQYVLNQGSAMFTSENIDTRNYKDVKVIYGIRTVTESGAFEASDSVVVGARTSNSGVDFPGDVVVASFAGGGAGSGQSTLVASTTPKKAKVPTSAADDTASPNWKQVGFNDASWPFSGINGVGYERGTDPATSYNALIGAGLNVRTPMDGINGSCYIRIPFTSPNPSTLTGLQLLVKYDDGFIAYLNGTEVARTNAPTPAAYNSTATALHDDTAALAYVNFDITAMKGLLVAGPNNVLALHGLNDSLTSSDFVILPELQGSSGGGAPTFPPANLNDLRGEFVGGSFFTYEKSIPDAVESLYLYMNANVNESSEYFFADNIRVTGTPLAVDSFETWIQLETDLERGEEESGPEGNPDGDPLLNLVEYAVGGDAEIAEMVHPVSGLPLEPQVEIVQDPNGTRWIEMSFRMLNLTVSGQLTQPIGGYTVRDVKYIPQIALEIGDWDDGANGNTVAQLAPGSDFVDNGDGTLTVRVRFTRQVTPGLREVYVRLLVEQVAL